MVWHWDRVRWNTQVPRNLRCRWTELLDPTSHNIITQICAFKSAEHGPSWKFVWWPEKSELLTHQLQFYFWLISIPGTTFIKVHVVGGRSRSGGLGWDGVQHRTIFIIDCDIMYVRMPSMNYSSLSSGIPDTHTPLFRILLYQRDLNIY
jgi:hypothetical protein